MVSPIFIAGEIGEVATKETGLKRNRQMRDAGFALTNFRGWVPERRDSRIYLIHLLRESQGRIDKRNAA